MIATLSHHKTEALDITTLALINFRLFLMVGFVHLCVRIGRARAP